MAKKTPDPKKPVKKKDTSKSLKLETKQQIKLKEKYQAPRLYGTDYSKPVYKKGHEGDLNYLIGHKINDPYTTPIKGRQGVSDKVADAHNAVSKFSKKKKKK